MSEKKLDLDTISAIQELLFDQMNEATRKIRYYWDNDEMKAFYTAKLDTLDSLVSVLDRVAAENLPEDEVLAAEAAWEAIRGEG